jgi:hypothetical protein
MIKRLATQVAAAVWLLALHQLSMASTVENVHYLGKQDVTPNMPYDLNTISTCTYWYDNFEGLSCLDVRTSLNISAQTFSRWNPSITLSCDNWKEQSYCIEVKSERTTTSSMTTTTKTSTMTSSTARPTPTWQALGCYLDGTPRTLRNQSSSASGNSLTVANCEAACWAANFNFAGVEAGKECWCGSFMGNEMASNTNDCNMACSGASSETCGGISRINVYQAVTSTTTYIPTPYNPTIKSTTMPTPTSSPVNWQAVGCYAENNLRILRNKATVAGGENNNTRQGCIDTCDKAGYFYAGVQFARECWCDFVINSPGASAPAGDAGW